MGQILNRRRVMGGEDAHNADAYIQDGLIFQLDGIDYGGTAGHWIDKKQGIDFNLNNNIISKTEYGYLFNSANISADRAFPGDKNATGLLADSNTVEVCFKELNLPTSGNKIFLATTQNSNGPYLRMQKATGIYDIYSRTKSNQCFQVLDGEQNDITFSISSAPLNVVRGEEVQSSYVNQGYGADTTIKLYVCAWSVFQLCALRIYDRELSLKEMQFNQQLDNVRFKLGY